MRAFVIMDMLTSPWLSSSPSRIGPTPLNYTRAMWVLTPLPRARCQCQSQRRGAVAGVGWAADVRVREESRGEGEGRVKLGSGKTHVAELVTRTSSSQSTQKPASAWLRERRIEHRA